MPCLADLSATINTIASKVTAIKAQTDQLTFTVDGVVIDASAVWTDPKALTLGKWLALK